MLNNKTMNWLLRHSANVLILLSIALSSTASGNSAELIPATCPAPATGAFTGCYFNNINLAGEPVLVRMDSQIDFDWGTGPVNPSVSAASFSVNWQGNFNFAQANYTFTAITSDGMRVYIDGVAVLDRWRDQAPTIYTFALALTAGTHLITVQYYEHTGAPTAHLSWKPPSTLPVQPPVISSFSSAPSAIIAGQTATLSWNVSGSTSITIDNGVGDVTGRSSTPVFPIQTTTYTLTASNSAGASTAMATVTIASTPDTQPPTSPVLISATNNGTAEVDLIWTASADNVGVAGYQILRNGSVAGSVSAATLTYADKSVSAGSTYSYSVRAFDAAANQSAASNSLQVVIPASSLSTGACPGPANGAFTGCYFNNINLTGQPVLVRTDSQIDFDWGTGPVSPSVSAASFSVSWQGNFNLAQGTYNFTAITSDGMRVYIDGVNVLDRWRDQSPTVYAFTQPLAAGTHLIAVQYYEHTGAPTAHLLWQLPVTSPAPPPVITSFSSAPSAITAGQSAALSWNVSGSTSITIDNGVGDVTGRSTVSVSPVQTTTYTLTASNSASASTAMVTVTIPSIPDTQPPTTPVLISVTNNGAGEVDLSWTASSDNVGVAGYQILRNGSVIAAVPGKTLTYADKTVSAGSTYSYSVKAFDAALNYSAASSSLQVVTPVSSLPAGTCPGPATGGFTGCYYSNTTLSGNPVFIRADNQIAFQWGNGSPDPTLPALGFSARWQGNFTLSQGNYTFTAITSDGMRVYIDGNVIINAWRAQSPPNVYTLSQTVSQGTHLIVVEYYEQSGEATAEVSWQQNLPVTQVPAISSFTAAPSSTMAGQAVALSWGNVSGATSISLSNGVGDGNEVSLQRPFFPFRRPSIH